MAQSVLMSPRTFLRRFIEATGVPPEQSLIAERVADTQRQLERSAMQVEDIATRVEFGSAQVLRHHFRARLGLALRDVLRSPHTFWPGCSSARDMMLMEPTHNP